VGTSTAAFQESCRQVALNSNRAIPKRTEMSPQEPYNWKETCNTVPASLPLITHSWYN